LNINGVYNRERPGRRSPKRQRVSCPFWRMALVTLSAKTVLPVRGILRMFRGTGVHQGPLKAVYALSRWKSRDLYRLTFTPLYAYMHKNAHLSNGILHAGNIILFAFPQISPKRCIVQTQKVGVELE
jgi:hypothetical protein